MKLKISNDLGDKPTGILYVLEIELEDKKLVKIGITNRKVEERVCQILTELWKKYRVFPRCYVARYKSVEDNRKYEAILHEYFCQYKYTTEHKWGGYDEVFHLDVEVVKEAYDRLLDKGTLDEDSME